MPIFEYRCGTCRRITSEYVKDRYSSPQVICSHCGGNNTSRAFSSFAIKKTYHDVYDDIIHDDQLSQRMMVNDPQAMAEWSRKMEMVGDGRGMGPEYQEMIGRLDKGENWKSIADDMQSQGVHSLMQSDSAE